MRKEFKMTEEDLKELKKAFNTGPAIALHCGPIVSPQESANRAWARLGEKMGFAYMTVKPCGADQLVFTAEEKD